MPMPSEEKPVSVLHTGLGTATATFRDGHTEEVKSRIPTEADRFPRGTGTVHTPPPPKRGERALVGMGHSGDTVHLRWSDGTWSYLHGVDAAGYRTLRAAPDKLRAIREMQGGR